MVDKRIGLILLAILGCAWKISAEVDSEDEVNISFLLPTELEDILEEDSNDDADEIDILGDPNPTPCCAPPTWQGTVKSMFGVAKQGRGESELEEVDPEKKKRRDGPKILASTFILYVDQPNQRIAGKHLCPKSGNVTFQFILTFTGAGNDSSATLYVFSNLVKKCRVKKLPRAKFQKQCLPSDAVYEGTVSLGPQGGLSVQSWGFFAKGRGAVIGGNALVTPGACVPVLVREFGSVGSRLKEGEDKPKPRPKPKHSGKAFVGSVYYSNVQRTISDPSVFTPPSYCKAADDEILHFEPEENALESILERYVR